MYWNEYNLKSWIVNKLLSINIIKPTQVQKTVITEALEHKNLIVSSPTGSGKTYAFLLPIINNINVDNPQIQAIIICPTKELASQILQTCKKLIEKTNISVKNFIGQISIKEQQRKVIAKQPHIVIGTISKIKELYIAKILNITTAKTLVIDECDMLFETEESKELAFILEKMSDKIQKLAFSATINQKLQNFLKKYFTNTKIIDLNKQLPMPKIEHIFINYSANQLEKKLLELISIINPFVCLVFVNNHQDANKIGKLIANENKSIVILHGKLASRERQQIIKRIKKLDYQYVVCSDVAARGLDIPEISHIISMQLPYEIQYYLHRAGRTGRNQASGTSYVFFNTLSNKTLEDLKKLSIKPNYYKIKNMNLVPEKQLKKSNIKTTKTMIEPKNKKLIKPNYKKKAKKELLKLKKFNNKTKNSLKIIAKQK